jgi:hypothetical protein
VGNRLTTTLCDAKFAFQVKAGTIHVCGVPGETEMLMNKVSFYAYARQLGIQTPRTFGLHNRADAEQVAGELAPGTKGGG